MSVQEEHKEKKTVFNSGNEEELKAVQNEPRRIREREKTSKRKMENPLQQTTLVDFEEA